MVFSSLQFILIFMPIFFTVYYLTPGKYRNAVLLAGSLSFYLVGTINAPGHFVLFVASIVADFLAGICMEKQQKYKKAILSCTIIFHLLCLCIFKYANFVLGELGKICDGFPSFNEIILPIGVSFYTFQGKDGKDGLGISLMFTEVKSQQTVICLILPFIFQCFRNLLPDP